ncbi:MAG: hypothetical protein ABIF01_05785, partial [Candidatus Micrarchaeota archaeon]
MQLKPVLGWIALFVVLLLISVYFYLPQKIDDECNSGCASKDYLLGKCFMYGAATDMRDSPIADGGVKGIANCPSTGQGMTGTWYDCYCFNFETLLGKLLYYPVLITAVL